MIIEIEINEEELLKEIMQNVPEYVYSLYTSGYHYKTMKFVFEEKEEADNAGTQYKIGMKELKEGARFMVDDIVSGKLKGYKLEDYFSNDLDVVGNWDSDMVDMLVQYSIYGEVIYG